MPEQRRSPVEPSSADHELLTPLAGMRALLQSLQLGAVPARDQQQLLHRGLRECDRLERAARDVLARAAPARGQVTAHAVSEELLAEEGSVAVRRCCPEHLRLSLGPMTLRIDEDGLRLLHRVLEEAIATLVAMASPPEALDA